MVLIWEHGGGSGELLIFLILLSENFLKGTKPINDNQMFYSCLLSWLLGQLISVKGQGVRLNIKNEYKVKKCFLKARTVTLLNSLQQEIPESHRFEELKPANLGKQH